MKKIISSLTVGLMLFSAFALANPANIEKAQKKKGSRPYPGWVSNPDAFYNPKLYLTGVGSGLDENSAIEDAKAQLISSLKQNISSNTILVTTDNSKSTTAELKQDVDTSSAIKDLAGVKIAETFFSTENKVYVLAAVKRQDAADHYASIIKTNDSKIAEYMEFTSTHKDNIQSCIFANKAYSLALENDYYLDVISVLGAPSGVDTSLSYGSSILLQQKVIEVKENVPVQLRIEGDINGMAEASFKKDFEKLGILTASGDLKPYILVVGITLEQVESDDKKHSFYNYSYTAELVSSKNDTYFTYSAYGRAGHVNLQGAQNKAMLLLTKDIESKFYEKLAHFAETGEQQ